MPSTHPGQVDSPGTLVTFQSHLPNGKGIEQVIGQLNKTKTKTCPGQAKFESYLFQGQARIHDDFFVVLANCIN